MAALLLAGGCSGGKGAEGISKAGGTGGASGAGEVRKEFVILRELSKQYAIQSEAGNEARVAAVERYLGERLASLPDEGQCEEEREIVRAARAAAHSEK